MSRAQCQDKTKPCVWQLHTYTNTHTHLDTNIGAHKAKHSLMHAHSKQPAPKTCKQVKKKKKSSPYLYKSMHSYCAQQGAATAKEKKPKKNVSPVSNKTNLHTPELRSEYAWKYKTICLEADHPVYSDYCTHLRAFYPPPGMQSSWFSARLLMVSHNKLDLQDDNLLKGEDKHCHQSKKKGNLCMQFQ